MIGHPERIVVGFSHQNESKDLHLAPWTYTTNFRDARLAAETKVLFEKARLSYIDSARIEQERAPEARRLLAPRISVGRRIAQLRRGVP
jgi:hypothetical protein